MRDQAYIPVHVQVFMLEMNDPASRPETAGDMYCMVLQHKQHVTQHVHQCNTPVIALFTKDLAAFRLCRTYIN